MTTLYVNGTIHSTSDPYATALLVDAGSVAWVGADDTAEQMLRRSGDGWQVVDLDGALVAPAFVDSLTDPAGAGAAASHGVFLPVSVTDDAGGAGSAAEGAAVRYVRTDPAHVPASAADALTARGGQAGLAAAVGPAGLDASATARLAEAATAAGVQVYFLPQDAAGVQAVLAGIAAAAEAHGDPAVGRARHRLAWNGPLAPEAIDQLARRAMSVTVVPDAEGTVTAPVASLLKAGVPVCLGTGEGTADLWAAIRCCLEHPDPAQRISARAGFTAATRAGLRALPAAAADRHGMAGRIVPSAPATFGIWTTEALSVQAPDGRVAAWSTDTRAGTPLLPVLEEGTAAPRCLATVAAGAEAYRF